MSIGPIIFSAALVAWPAATVYDCSYEKETQQALEEVVVTHAAFERKGRFQVRLSLNQDLAELSASSGKGQDILKCTSSDATNVVLCSSSGDQRVFVLFLRSGKFSISLQDHHETSWAVVTGSCQQHRAVSS